jgi:hypothetical protein
MTLPCMEIPCKDCICISICKGKILSILWTDCSLIYDYLFYKDLSVGETSDRINIMVNLLYNN